MAVSTKAREKCIAKARKSVQHQQKYGWIDAIFLLTYAVFSCAAVGCIYYLIFTHLTRDQTVEDAVKHGWAAGLFLGFMAGGMLFAGMIALFGGVRSLRGDATTQLLVEYHDTLELLVRKDGTEY